MASNINDPPWNYNHFTKPIKWKHCSVMNCYNTSEKNPKMTFYSLPRDPVRAELWLKKIHRQNNRNKKMQVCEQHFKSEYINDNETRKRLMATAVPTLQLPTSQDLQCDPDVGDLAASTAQVNEANAKENKRHTTKRYSNIKRAKLTIENFKKTTEVNTRTSQKHIAEIIKLNNKFRQPLEGEKLTDEFKFFALKLYFSSPKTYKVMQSVLHLPTISTLYRLYIPSSTELCENLIIALKIKADTMSDVQKQCAVCISTVAVRAHLSYDAKKDQIDGFHDVDGSQRLEPAETALIVMVRGIFDTWKQVVAFLLLGKYQDYEDVRKYIDKIIHKMIEIGLNVRVFISDSEADFIGLSREKRIKFSNPAFSVDGKRIYYMYDPSHLMKDVRKHFMACDFYFNEMVAKWEHITACYDHDVTKESLRLAPKLTCYHIIDTHLQSDKDRVKLAAEVFSKSTAVAVSTYADLKVIDKSAKETVEWIILMNKLFTMLNFSSDSFDGETNNAFPGEMTQVEFLNEMLSLFHNLRVFDIEKGTDVTHSAKFLYRIKLTIKSVLSLHKDLKCQYFKFPMIGLTRDCLDTFFDKVQQQYGRLPTSRQIQVSFSKMPIFNVFQCISKKQSTDNLHYFLMEAANFSDVEMYEQIDSKVRSINAYYSLTANINFNAVELSEENALQHMAAFVLYEGYQQHNECEAMRCYTFENNESVAVILTIRSKTQTDNTVVVMVPTEFVEFIESMELTLKLYFEIEYQRNPLMGLKEHLFSENITFSMPCKCFPLAYVKVLYIRYRFNVLLKYNNNKFQNMKDLRKYFKINEL